MSFVQSVFFESPFWLGVVCFLLFAIVLFARRSWEGAWARYSLPGVLALIVLLFVIQDMVTTDRERVYQTVTELAHAVEQRDAAAIHRHFSTAYNCDEFGYEQIMDCLDAILEQVTIKDSRISMGQAEVDDGHAELVLNATATVGVRGGVGEFHTGSWRLGLVRENEEWRVASLHPQMIDGVTVRSMHDLRSFVP